ncbi:MAG: hypothetical protein FWD17_03835 [Polyangiaceae bacterium]|nr:hypothetical protein [Polyangiaceae bacterium]
MRIRAALVLGTTAGLAFGARSLGAQSGDPSAEPVRVVVDGPEGCADAARFLDEVRARTPLARPAAEGENARRFHVTVSRENAAARGTLVIDDADRATTPRTVVGESCDEVVGALALIAALAIDPAASIAPPASGAPDAGRAAAPAPSRPGSGSPAAPPAPKPKEASTGRRETLPIAPVRRTAEAPPVRAAGAWHVSTGALFDVVGAAAPSAVVGASAFVEAERQAGSIVGPAIRAGFAAFGDRTLQAGPGDARFIWWAGQVDVCPLRFSIASALVAKPCAAAEAGVLEAHGSGVSNARGKLRPWVSLGAVARFELALTRLFSIDAYGGLRAPVTREAFVFQPGLSVYRAPPEMLVGGAGLGVRFP